MRILLAICLLLLTTFCVSSQTNSTTRVDWAKLNSKQQLQALTFTTAAYRKEALELVIKDANRVAQELNLPEQLPITETNLVTSHISPPRMAQGLKTIGTITTSNYVYAPFAGHGFSLVRTRFQEEYILLQKEYLWPMSRMDTNAAYESATQLLKAASINVKALNHDCSLTIRAFTPEGEHGSHFVPVYWVSWGKDGSPVASVELFEPTKTIRQMQVNKPEYFLRKPLEITNLDFLLSQTNVPP
jgi:hypothetical protein